MTIPTQLVLRALLADPARELYGVEVSTAAGLPSGTVHPILARLEGVGWLTSRWEEFDPRAEGRLIGWIPTGEPDVDDPTLVNRMP